MNIEMPSNKMPMPKLIYSCLKNANILSTPSASESVFWECFGVISFFFLAIVILLT
jgi:hypothetical protein